MLPMLPIFMYTDKVIPLTNLYLLSLLNIKTGEEDTDKMVKFTTYNLLSLLIIQTGGMIQTGFIICIPLSLLLSSSGPGPRSGPKGPRTKDQRLGPYTKFGLPPPLTTHHQ